MGEMMARNKLQKLLLYMGDRVWTWSELWDLFVRRVDSGTQYGMNASKRFSYLHQSGMKRGFILRPERSSYIVSKKGKKYAYKARGGR